MNAAFSVAWAMVYWWGLALSVYGVNLKPMRDLRLADFTVQPQSGEKRDAQPFFHNIFTELSFGQAGSKGRVLLMRKLQKSQLQNSSRVREASPDWSVAWRTTDDGGRVPTRQQWTVTEVRYSATIKARNKSESQ